MFRSRSESPSSRQMRRGRLRRRRHLRAGGWVVLVSLALVLMAAWNTGTNLLYLVAGGLASFLLVSVLLTAWSTRGLRVFREAPDAVHRGDEFTIRVRIENRKWVMSALSLRLEGSRGAGPGRAYVTKVPPRRAAIARVVERLERRGVFALPQTDIVTHFPFGLFERRLRPLDDLEIVVYPQVRAIRPAMVQQLAGQGAVTRFVRGEGDEFFSLREYVPGDDLRSVAWRISAHRGTLIVRESARATTRFLVLVMDTRLRTDIENYAEQFEDAVELAASLAVTFLNQQYSVALVTQHQFLAGGSGQAHAIRVLDFLARAQLRESAGSEDFGWFRPGDDLAGATHVYISPDPSFWNRPVPGSRGRVLDPKEVVRA